MCIPIRFPVRNLDNQETLNRKGRIAAIDPGVRTFAAIYDTNGTTIEVGNNDIGRMYRLGHAVDKLQSKWNKRDDKQEEKKNWIKNCKSHYYLVTFYLQRTFVEQGERIFRMQSQVGNRRIYFQNVWFMWNGEHIIEIKKELCMSFL